MDLELGLEIRSRRWDPIRAGTRLARRRGTEESEGPGSRLMVIQREHRKQEESSPDRVPLMGQK